MKSDWNDVIEREIASLSGYRTANHWFLCKRTWNDSPSSSDSKPPEMQDDWKPVEFPIELTEKGEFWFRLNYTIPKEIHGIPVSGSRTVLQSRTLKPMEVFLDGKSIFSARYWSDLCVPEAVLTEKADTGRTCEILVRVDNTGSNGINDRIEIAIEIERLEDLLFELETFIESEEMDEDTTKTQFKKLDKARSDLAGERFKFLMESRKILGNERFREVKQMYKKNRRNKSYKKDKKERSVEK